jgi:Ca-activated chloride channel family protein
MKRLGLIAAATITALLLPAMPVLADGIIIPEPVPPGPEPWPEPIHLRDTWLTIRYHRVSVNIEDQVAVTRVEQEFVNEREWEIEGTYIFPLPEGAAISEFVMWVDGQRVEGEILEAEEARSIYEDIVRQRRDPALLEYVGRSAVQASVFPIPPGGSRKVELEYSEVLAMDSGVVRYVYPLNTEKFSARELEEVSVRVEIDSPEAMRAVYSPTHQDRVYVERDGEHRAVVGYEESDVLPDLDFEVVYTVSEEDVGLNLLTYRDRSEDGFFLLMVAPSVEAQADEVIARDILLVIDTSGSMQGEKIEQAKEALTYVLDHLNEHDRFNVFAFSSGVRQYARGLAPASERDEAVDWVERLQAAGGTDINRALLDSLSELEEDRPAVLIFLTDGLPTEGVTQVDQILANVDSAAPANLRLFPFGVGDDVNTTLLDTLAEQNRGVTGYVRPHEEIDEEVSGLYARISTPVLADIAIDFQDAWIEETLPDPLPDLYAGRQLVLVGRYREGGATRITLTGEVNGSQRQFAYEGVLKSDGGDSFIPRLWATRKIGYLLTQIRLHGEQEEWVDAVVGLSIRYGIITPYTSFLIDEDDILTEEGRGSAGDRFSALPTASPSGAPALEMADSQGKMSQAESLGGGSMPQEAAEILRTAGDKTFLLQDGVWTDTQFDPSQMTTEQVGFGSDLYFQLVAARPEWGVYFAVGERVIFLAEGSAYEVVGGEGENVELPPELTAEPGASSGLGSAGLCPLPMALALGAGAALVALPRRRR